MAIVFNNLSASGGGKTYYRYRIKLDYWSISSSVWLDLITSIDMEVTNDTTALDLVKLVYSDLVNKTWFYIPFYTDNTSPLATHLKVYTDINANPKPFFVRLLDLSNATDSTMKLYFSSCTKTEL